MTDERPKTLFKYRSLSGAIRDLRLGTIRFTQLDALNDPFENDPFIHWGKWRDEAKSEGIQKKLSDAYLAQREFYNKTLVLSLSESPDDPLMWSHYADEGRGVALGFSGENLEWLDDISDTVRAIVYSKTRQHSFPSAPNSKPNPDALFLKGPHWGYEREWRGVILRENFHSHRRYRGNHTSIHTFEYDNNSISEIICGPRWGNAGVFQLIETIRMYDLNARLSCAEIDGSEYKLNIKDSNHTLPDKKCFNLYRQKDKGSGRDVWSHQVWGRELEIERITVTSLLHEDFALYLHIDNDCVSDQIFHGHGLGFEVDFQNAPNRLRAGSRIVVPDPNVDGPALHICVYAKPN
ncbi:MAG: DUF2971 domain-containing protein [Deltaproteobacteria bacterium]|nr:DUF2971 domain-containing protein [Deltaproteobacteria bacterium]